MTDQWVTFARHGRAEVVRLSGEIELANVHDIGRAIARHTTAAGAVLIDLTAVSFLDSAGVRLLDALAGDLGRGGIPFRLVVGERGAARTVLQMCAFRDELLTSDLERAAAEIG